MHCQQNVKIPHTFLYDALEGRYKQHHRTVTFSKRSTSQSDNQQVNKKTGWLTKMAQVLPNIRVEEGKYEVEWNILWGITSVCHTKQTSPLTERRNRKWADVVRYVALELSCNTSHRLQLRKRWYAETWRKCTKRTKIGQLSFTILEFTDSCNGNLIDNHAIIFSLINVTLYYKLNTL